MFTKNTWIGDVCYINNDNTVIFDIEDIDESEQGSSCNMNAMKKAKICMTVQVECSEMTQPPQPIKY